jgi:hypothetical protein
MQCSSRRPTLVRLHLSGDATMCRPTCDQAVRAQICSCNSGLRRTSSSFAPSRTAQPRCWIGITRSTTNQVQGLDARRTSPTPVEGEKCVGIDHGRADLEVEGYQSRPFGCGRASKICSWISRWLGRLSAGPDSSTGFRAAAE